MRDQTQLMRITTRLMELGVLTPQQGMDMFHTGQFPQAKEISPAQNTFNEERKEGYYNPLVGGVPLIAPGGDGQEQVQKNTTNKVAGRPEGTTGIPLVKGNYSVKGIQSVVKKIEKTRASISNSLKKKLNIKKFNEQQENMLNKLCEAVVVSNEIETWESVANSCVNNFDNIASLNAMPDVLSILAEHQLEDDYSAAILYHSKKINEN
jgi:hypothetical protein